MKLKFLIATFFANLFLWIVPSVTIAKLNKANRQTTIFGFIVSAAISIFLLTPAIVITNILLVYTILGLILATLSTINLISPDDFPDSFSAIYSLALGIFLGLLLGILF